MWILVFIVVAIILLAKILKNDKAIAVLVLTGGIVYFTEEVMNPNSTFTKVNSLKPTGPA